jgi:hypothetical protein
MASSRRMVSIPFVKASLLSRSYLRLPWLETLTQSLGPGKLHGPHQPHDLHSFL